MENLEFVHPQPPVESTNDGVSTPGNAIDTIFYSAVVGRYRYADQTDNRLRTLSPRILLLRNIPTGVVSPANLEQNQITRGVKTDA